MDGHEKDNANSPENTFVFKTSEIRMNPNNLEIAFTFTRIDPNYSVFIRINSNKAERKM